MKKITFIYNPVSGVMGKRMIMSQVEERIDRSQFEIEVVKTAWAGHATLLARQAVEAGADIVCAVGGDGTMNEVARALIGTRVALAIIPCGSGNGLARHLHIPLDPIRAIELINTATIRQMDYGLINQHPFFCTCGVGFDAFISEKFAKAKLRGPLTYVENVLTNGLKYNPETYDIDIIGEHEEHSTQKAFLIACGNASQYGNNFYITPGASVRDGLLDVTIIKPFTVLDAPQVALQLVGGTVESNHLFSTFRCRNITIHRQKSGVIHYDGDPIMSGPEVHISVVPHGINCVCPSKEGVLDVAENIQNVVMEQFGLMQMRSDELLRANRQANRRIREQTERTNRRIREETKKLISRIKK